jgi:hypothetical protein
MPSLLGTRSGWFNRACFLLFGTRVGARVLYPAGKDVPQFRAELLGIGYIRNLEGAAAGSAA